MMGDRCGLLHGGSIPSEGFRQAAYGSKQSRSLLLGKIRLTRAI